MSYLDVGVNTALVTYAEEGMTTMDQDGAIAPPPEASRRSIGTSPDRSVYAHVSIHQTPKPEPKPLLCQHSGTTLESSPEPLSAPGDLPSILLIAKLTFSNVGYISSTTDTNRFRTSSSRRSSNAVTLGITSEVQ